MITMSRSLNRILAAATATVLISGFYVPLAAADQVYIYIRTAADMKDLADNCMIDSYSWDKIVVLDADIDVSSSDFTYIPYFGGVFEGNGHTISGLELEVTNPERGFIGTVGSSGVIKNLNISATITEGKGITENENVNAERVLDIIEDISGDSRLSAIDRFFEDTGIYSVGGIAGINSGTISGCSFYGSAELNKNVGGIAGVNYGRIETSTNYGAIKSDENTGGIAGKNQGVIKWCVNNGRINDHAVEGMYATGGITGYSEGVIDSCQNYGTVGYKNTGSATGGICGAQSGRVNECQNFGAVYGKKRVGGIVGNFEPYTNITYNPDEIWDRIDEEKDKIRSDLDDLQDRFDKNRQNIKDDLDDFDERIKDILGINDITDAIHDANDNFNTLSTSLADLNDTVNRRIANGHSLESIADSIERAEGTLSANSGDVRDFLVEARNSAKTISDTTEAVSGSLIASNDNLAEILDTINGDLSDSERRQQITDALDSLDDALASTSDAMDHLSTLNIPTLRLDILEDTDTQLSKVLRRFNNEYSGLLEPFVKLNEDLSSAIDVLRERRERLKSIREDLGKLLDDVTPTIAPIATMLPIENESASVSFFVTAYAAEDNDKSTLDRLLDMDIHDVDIPLEREICGESYEMAVVNYSINSGTVSGTSDIGGISGGVGFGVTVGGSFANINSDGKEFSLNPSTAIKSVISACINEGDITAKSTSAGGITGFSDLGKIKDSINSGDISVTDGRYAGGITGYNLNDIMRCINLGDVNAKSDIGGIAGYGKNISQCYALTRTDSAGERRGAIAGSTTGTVESNYFLKERLGGINGVDYSGRAQSVTKEVLASDGDLSPELSGLEERYWTGTYGDLYMPQLRAFTENSASGLSDLLKAKSASSALFRFTAEFVIDGETVKTINLDYGEKLKSSDIPPIPKIDGQYGEWDKDLKAAIIRNTKFTAVYNKSKTTLSYGEPPQLLVEGDFTPGAELVVEEFNPAAVINSKKYEPIAGYGFMVLENSEKYDGDMRVRVRVPQGGNMKIGIIKENSVVIVDSTTDGRYLVFDPEGADRFIVLKVKKSIAPYIISGIALLVLLALLFVFRKRIFNRRPVKAARRIVKSMHAKLYPADAEEKAPDAEESDKKSEESEATAKTEDKAPDTDAAEGE